MTDFALVDCPPTAQHNVHMLRKGKDSRVPYPGKTILWSPW